MVDVAVIRTFPEKSSTSSHLLSTLSKPLQKVSRRHRGVALCLTAAVGAGLSAVFAAEARDGGVGVASMLTLRFAIAAVVLWTIVAVRRPALPAKRTVLACLLLGAGGYALQAGLYFSALTKMDAATVSLLLYVYPALVVLFAVMTKRERMHTRKGLALTCSAVGLTLLLRSGATAGTLVPVGVALGLGSALMWALYVTFAELLPKQLDGYATAALVCTGAATSLGLFSASTGQLHVPNGHALVWIALLAIVATVMTTVCLLAGVRLVGASSAALVSCIEPVVTALSTVAMFGASLSPGQMMGGATVLASVLVLELRLPKRSPAMSGDGFPAEELAA